MTETYTPWDAADHLKNKTDVRAYLEACAEDDPGDGSLIRAALGDIARSGNLSQLARDASMTREGLYKALGPEGNPSFATVLKVARALGLTLHFAPAANVGQQPPLPPAA